jgi:hypothetical protein
VSLRCGVGVTADWDSACPLGFGSGGDVEEKREERVLAGASALMSTHASVLVDSVGPPSAEVCRTAASFS